MTNNVKVITSESWDGVISEWVEIDKGDNEFTYVTKDYYDSMQTEPSAE
jgi:hypothetical protein